MDREHKPWARPAAERGHAPHAGAKRRPCRPQRHHRHRAGLPASAQACGSDGSGRVSRTEWRPETGAYEGTRRLPRNEAVNLIHGPEPRTQQNNRTDPMSSWPAAGPDSVTTRRKDTAMSELLIDF